MENTPDRHWTSTRTYAKGENLGAVHDDDRLRGFAILRVAEGPSPYVTFTNDVTMRVGEPKEYSSAAGQQPREQARFTPGARHPVFNVIDRAQRETKLTRDTLDRIFRALSADVQRKVFTNPEGWATVFVGIVRDCVADLVAQSLTFEIAGTRTHDLEEPVSAHQAIRTEGAHPSWRNRLVRLRTAGFWRGEDVHRNTP